MVRWQLAAFAAWSCAAAAPSGGCSSHADCFHNGECTTAGECRCELPWSGPQCSVLLRLPADPAAGFHSPHDDGAPRNVSSWGGSVLKGDDGKYHMFAAEMVQSCGIEWWEPNSQVVHAVSETAAGPYRRESVVAVPFAHEPTAMRAPTGEWVVLMTMRHPSQWAPVDCDTPQPPPPPPPPGPRPCYPPPARHTYMVWSDSPYGPWSEPVRVLKANYSTWGNCSVLIDTNLAGVILPNGSLVGIWRKCSNVPAFEQCKVDCCTFPHLLTASDWRDPTTYYPHPDPMFPNMKPYGSEDPFLWRDGRGHYHAMFHDEQGATRSNAKGRHAASTDGVNWRYADVNAYNGSTWVTAPGGGSAVREVLFGRRERPHLIIDHTGRPTHLINGVQEDAAQTNCSRYAQCDRSYTFVQPLLR
eukprot:TRINITY_DN29489_c4_g1_i1.p1 TRINITY_DN29489_c4_g1~~TRINITY_DN29489_c4_g1_i1.p1  ORF type:complete len:443 (+),score=86.05 TRINITY_DN29489_c4_g1_i1:89-1330(+)